LTAVFVQGSALVLLTFGAARAQAQAPAAQHGACSTLASAALPDAKILSAESIDAGAFSPGQPLPPSPVASFCRVKVVLSPSVDSDIQVEVWLPDAWNGKYLAIGIGGWGGFIPYPGMLEALRAGYATSGTDTGHRGNPGAADFALGHPEKLTDYAWRAVHEMTLQAKSLVSAYYGSATRRSYFSGCSAGGKQGMMEVQRFPDDYDGVIVGSAASDWVGLNTGSLYTSLLNLPKGRPPILTPVQGALLHKAVLAQCDRLDGLEDGEVADPRVCKFKSTSVLCKPGQPAEQCLTREQTAVADKLYQAVRDPNTGQLIEPGFMPSSELGWGAVAVPMPPAVGFFKDALFDNPNWDPYTFNLGLDYEVARRNDTISAISPDLSAFVAHGGKVLQYHGWSDPIIPTETAINYYESVVTQQHGLGKVSAFYKLYLVPGMGHCSGGYQVDWVGALDQWVEQGHSPDQVIGRRLPQISTAGSPGGPPPEADSNAPTRPICAYPGVAHYTGRGSSDTAANFSCRVSARGPRPGDVASTAIGASLP
jgi:feruloyl esterase